MSDPIGGGEEVARLWKVNRTIHELVKDRVCRYSMLYILLLTIFQGFQVSDDEIHMDLATFRQLYASNGGVE